MESAHEFAAETLEDRIRERAYHLWEEELLEPDPSFGHPAAYLIDMQMMAMFGVARARTEDEFSALLAASGLTLRRVVTTASSVSIIEASPE